MFLFVVSDFYDLNNCRVLIDYLANKGIDTDVYFLTTPIKPYRKVFQHHRNEFIDNVDMTDKVKKHIGTIQQFNEFISEKEFGFTFICCSYYQLLKKMDFFKYRAQMGKLCMITWGFDGTKDDNKKAYRHADHVFAEGPFFFSLDFSSRIREKYMNKITFAHPYYDIFGAYTKDYCREKLRILTDKKVLLIPETGNIAEIKEKWGPLYKKIIKSVNRNEYYIVFKARKKTVKNKVHDFVDPIVDRYIENEWYYPPCSALVSMASDACILPCESKFALDSIMARTPTSLYSKGQYKNDRSTAFFGHLAKALKFDPFVSMKDGTFSYKFVDYNKQVLKDFAVCMQDGGNCKHILKTLGIK